MNFKYENKKHEEGYENIAGCDEVGRGCLAGPVVAAAVCFDFRNTKVLPAWTEEIQDSKLLKPQKREELSKLIKQNSVAWGIGVVDEKTIDLINIHQATLRAMKLAFEDIVSKTNKKDFFLTIDGKFIIPEFNIEQEAVVDGDAKVLSVAAASIIAKVFRDNLMVEFDKQYPEYNFAKHKGYGTVIHGQSITKYGLCPIHRKSFCKKFV